MVVVKFISFLVGVYVGIYIDQNYKIPKADDPAALYEKVKEFAENYKKDKGS